MKKFFTKILMLEITSRKGLIGWYKKYKTMGKEIRDVYGDLTYENYCKYKTQNIFLIETNYSLTAKNVLQNG